MVNYNDRMPGSCQGSLFKCRTTGCIQSHDIYFIAGEQFSYTAAVDGVIVREKPQQIFILDLMQPNPLSLRKPVLPQVQFKFPVRIQLTKFRSLLLLVIIALLERNFMQQVHISQESLNSLVLSRARMQERFL